MTQRDLRDEIFALLQRGDTDLSTSARLRILRAELSRLEADEGDDDEAL